MVARHTFLSSLQQNPSDLDAWQVFADWLDDQQDPSGPFLRSSIRLILGDFGSGHTDPFLEEFTRQYNNADAEIRELMTDCRSRQPVRFLVSDCFRMGQNPPIEMFGYPRSIVCGYLQTGTLKPGMDLNVCSLPEGKPRRVASIMVYSKDVDELVAGREPFCVGLGFIGHIFLDPGTLLTVENPPAAPPKTGC